LTIALTLLIGAAAGAQAKLWPDVRYDPAIPTIKHVLGYETGDQIASHAEIMKYMTALSEAAPDRMRVFSYAKSWEGRELFYAAIGTEDVIEQLDVHSAAMRRLSDPRPHRKGEAKMLIGALKAPVWLAYGVHGNEISSPDASLFLAYHLLAAQGDAVVNSILENTLIFIDPTQNPDGRDRFVNHFRQERGLAADEHRLAAEHNEPWPGGRTNHYFFDLNRDWFIMSQPETRGKIAALREHKPVVVIDLHEMGGDSSYYFAPPAEPHNPHLVQSQHDHLELVGKKNAAFFDQFGFDYFTRETYDWFYPGYGDSWPAFYGAAASTYEQASPRGLKWRQRDGDLLTYFGAVQRHFVASMGTLAAAAENRERFLSDYHQFQATAIDEGKKGSVRAYGLPLIGDESLVHKLAGLLVQQGVEVERSSEAFEAGGTEFPKGSYLIPLAQPMGRFVRTMFDENTPMRDEFIQEQERRRAKRLSHQMYDVTAWSFPHLFNLKSIPLKSMPKVDSKRASNTLIQPGNLIAVEAPVAYLVEWGSLGAARFLAGALKENLNVLSVDKTFTQNGTTYPGGTLIIKTKDNSTNIAETLATLAKESGADVEATASTWVDDGVNFGSRHTVKVRNPRIALAWDRPTSSNSAGATRYVLEREIGIPVTTIRMSQLSSGDLQAFDVLILPDGSYSASTVSDAVCSRLKSWTRDGGTLIALGRATRFLVSERMKLLDSEIETLAAPTKEKKSDDDKEKSNGSKDGKIITTDAEYKELIRPEEVAPDVVPGVMLQARVNHDHWLGAGLPETLSVLYSGSQIVSPLKLNKGVNVAYYENPEDLLLSGYLWKENKAQLAFKPFILTQSTGRGLTIAFTSDPMARAYQNGLYVAFASAVLRGPAHTARP
jgi:hypothetical protein